MLQIGGLAPWNRAPVGVVKNIWSEIPIAGPTTSPCRLPCHCGLRCPAQRCVVFLLGASESPPQRVPPSWRAVATEVMPRLCDGSSGAAAAVTESQRDGSRYLCDECASRPVIEPEAAQTGASTLGKRQPTFIGVGPRSTVPASKMNKRAFLSGSYQQCDKTAPSKRNAPTGLSFSRSHGPLSGTRSVGSSSRSTPADVAANSGRPVAAHAGGALRSAAEQVAATMG